MIGDDELFDMFAAPVAAQEYRIQAPVMNERAAKRFDLYSAIDDYLDSDPRIRFEAMGSKKYELPEQVGMDAYFPVDQVKD